MIVETEGKRLKRKRKLSDSVSEQIQADNMEVSGQNHNMHGSLHMMDRFFLYFQEEEGLLLFALKTRKRRYLKSMVASTKQRYSHITASALYH